MDKDNAPVKKEGGGVKKLNVIIWTCVVILILLLLVTTTVLTLRIGNFLPNDLDIIFLVPKQPSFEASDDKAVWITETEVDIFKAEYKNDKEEITVLSGTGNSVFAPGTIVDYNFKFKNNGNMALDYNVILDFEFLKDGEDFELDKSSMLVRVYKDDDGAFIIGGEDSWIPVNELDKYEDKGTLGINSYSSYTLELKWPFESENDELDTWLGCLADEESLLLTLAIDTNAELNEDPEAVGGIIDTNGRVKQIGGQIDTWPFIILIILIVLTALGLVFGIFTKRKKKVEVEG